MANHCPVCHFEEADLSHDPTGADAFYVSCPRCGAFKISRTVARQLDASTEEEVAFQYAPRWVISAALRNRFEWGADDMELTTQTVETLLESASQPSDPLESINLLLRHLRREAATPSDAVQIIHHRDAPLVYARDEEELEYYLRMALNMDLVEQGPTDHTYRVGVEGWKRLRELDERRSDSNQAFVAMWFEDAMETVYSEGIQPALVETGYDPLRIDMEEHNDQIDSRIIAEIRRSGLLVADFTGQREGVYFEAGFALGLDIPVIWTCREDEVDNLHFDTRQYNHIVWSEPADLRDQLVNRIEATLP